jgi:predicted lipid-binding transport protein (Tim44 family)
MAWLGRAVDEADVSTGAGCGGTMLMIVFVGLAALALLFVGGAALGAAMIIIGFALMAAAIVLSAESFRTGFYAE